MFRLLAPALIATCCLTACGSPSTTAQTPAPTEASSASAATASSASPADLADPCTLLGADEINGALGTSFGAGTSQQDDARQIATCKYVSSDGTQIVNIGVSQTVGADAYKTNVDLAPAYFGGTAKIITVPGADKAYLVIADTVKAPVIGMLVKGHFVQLQVGVEGTTPAQGEQLAAAMAARIS